VLSGLSIELRATGARHEAGAPISLKGIYTNTGPEPFTLAFWWNRRIRVVDAQGRVVTPGPGPVLPCGIMEQLLRLAPGERHERGEALGCTQPAGRSEAIGWSYDLAPGTYRLTLVFEAPPAHGFSQGDGTWRGKVESNEVAIEVVPAPPRGLLSRIAGLFGA
jgi:hypothetical protein